MIKPKQIDLFLKILKEEIDDPMELRVAKRLWDAGYTEADVLDMVISYVLRISIANYMRDLESGEMCRKGGYHEYSTDGLHLNVFCKKCFKDQDKGSVCLLQV